MTKNVKIKTGPPLHEGGPGVPVNDGIWLVSGTPRLRPGEVVILTDKQADASLKALPYHLELTEDPHTRQLTLGGALTPSVKKETPTEATDDRTASDTDKLAVLFSSPE